MLDPLQYEFLFIFTTFADPEPGAGAETWYTGSSSGSGQKFQLLTVSPGIEPGYIVFLSHK